ncbi:MAG: ATPase V [Bacteroidales bacterium]|nr:ATPase V [Bacteroidales bacterium]
MITKMTKYSFILLSGESESFLENLQELGVVDIQRSTKPVDDKSASMLEKTLSVRSAISILEKVDYTKDEDYSAIRSAADSTCIEGCKTQSTQYAMSRVNELNAAIAAAEKSLKQVSPWGEYDKQAVDALAEKGIDIHYYRVPEKAFDESWASLAALQEIERIDGNVYFVTVARSDEAYSFPVHEIGAPEKSISQATEHIEALKQELIATKGKLLCLKENWLSHMQEGLQKKTADLDRYLAEKVGGEAAEGYICTFEGFAPQEDKERLEKAFDEMGVLYISEEATEQDNPPIKLRNNKFSEMFECLTGMYGMPVYGEWDPTPVLGVFFLLFFAMCMGDGGYGIILTIYGILQSRKIVNIGMFDGLGKLITALGISTTVVGLLFGTFFGVDLTTVNWIPEGIRNCMLAGDVNIGGANYALQMILAICVGVFHICLAMVIKAVLFTKRFGFKQNLGTWGWVLLIIGGLTLAICAMCFNLPQTVTKILLIAIAVLSALGIYLFNTPGRNPLKNIGPGLWETYNMATGLLGDVLSYIRLYALGLAGGMLGNAFNILGGLVLGDHPTWQFVPFILIMLFGHTLNMLMSCLGAFVHPLRLTFVEYFKNSGYEGKGTAYNPLKK